MKNPDHKPQEEKSSEHEEAWHSSIVPEELPYDFQQTIEAKAQAESLPTMVSEQTKLGISLLGAALIAGVSGNLLLRTTPWGINVSIWISIVVAAISGLIRWRKPHLLSGGNWLALLVIFFGATFAWRDSTTLNALSLLALVLLAGIVALCAREGKLSRAGVFDYAQTLVLGAIFTIFGPFFLVLSDTKWSELPRDGWSKQFIAIGRGVAIAAPLLLIFGGLFAAADAVYENIIAKTFNLDAGAVALHIFLTGVFAWLTAGFLRLLFLRSETTIQTMSRPEFLSLGIVETATVLSLLDLLFLSFVVVQFRYFFGGRANIPTGRGIEFAEYARSGFFELVWVSVLVLPLLLGAHWLLRKENSLHEKIFRVLAGIKLALLFVIMISAVQRMRLYQSEYGLTELRVYTMAFMGWLAIVFVWFAATVLRGQRERFAFGAVMTGRAMIAALHFMNPDALIAQMNLARAVEGKNFDAHYTGSLSADALPAITTGLPKLKAEDQVLLKARLDERWANYDFGDWRAWNWSRMQTRSGIRH